MEPEIMFLKQTSTRQQLVGFMLGIVVVDFNFFTGGLAGDSLQGDPVHFGCWTDTNLVSFPKEK